MKEIARADGERACPVFHREGHGHRRCGNDRALGVGTGGDRKRQTPHEAFLRDIEGYTRKITTELLACDKIFGHKHSGCACPKCGTGTMQFYGKVVRCDNPDCALPVFRQIAGRTLTDTEMTDLLAKGRTDVLSGFKSKQGKPFSAGGRLRRGFQHVFRVSGGEKNKKRTNMKGRRK